MSPGRFFYSMNRTDVIGPVSEDDLRRLWRDNRIGPGCCVWREGEAQWTRLAPDLSRVRAIKVVPSEVFAKARRASPPPASAPPPTSPIDPLTATRPSARAAKGIAAAIINAVAFAVAAGGVGFSTLPTNLSWAEVGARLSYRLGDFVGLLLVIVIISHFLALMAKSMTRVVIRALLMVAMSALVVGVHLENTGFSAMAAARAIRDRQKQEAQQEIASKGFYTADTGQAEENIQKLNGQITSDSGTARAARDILAVTTGLLSKVKASDKVEANCKFTLDGVKSPDDLTTQIAAIATLRAAQNSVVGYLEGYDQHCRDALAGEPITPATESDVIAGAHQSAHVDQLITLWQEKMKLSDDHIARFVFLRKNWGQWQFINGQVMFTSDAQATAYDTLVGAIQGDVGKIHDTQKQIFQ
jgi:hypothetical protein